MWSPGNTSSHDLVAGNYRKDDLLEAARIGHTEELMMLLTPLNVNCHAADGRKVLRKYALYNGYFGTTILCFKFVTEVFLFKS